MLKIEKRVYEISLEKKLSVIMDDEEIKDFYFI